MLKNLKKFTTYVHLFMIPQITEKKFKHATLDGIPNFILIHIVAI